MSARRLNSGAKSRVSSQGFEPPAADGEYEAASSGDKRVNIHGHAAKKSSTKETKVVTEEHRSFVILNTIGGINPRAGDMPKKIADARMHRMSAS